MEMTLGNHLTLEDLPKPGETIYFDGFISKHATETLNIASMQTVTHGIGYLWSDAILGGNGDGSIINAFTAAGIVIY